jgi:hypothetical protein
MKGISGFGQRVVLPGSLLTHLDETRSTQVGEVPRRSRLWNLKNDNEITDAHFPAS